MKVLVIAGGFSNERNVSLASGAMCAKALRERGHQVALVDLFMGEQDGVTFEDLTRRPIPEEWYSIAPVQTDLEAVKASRGYESNSVIGHGVLGLCKVADVAFLALHGGAGEDGRLQALLDLYGIPYTGSDYLASGLAMNKDITKSLASEAGVKTPTWQRTVVHDQDHVEALMQSLPIPCVVKIPNSGSSVGVYIVHSESELREALEATIGHQVLIEQFIQGREIQMAFFRDRPLPSIEIVPLDEFYTYQSKYSKGAAIETTPADIPPQQEQKMGEALMQVAHALKLYSYARADFIIDEAGEIWFIEINTLPGMTPTSLVPQEAAAAGYEFGAFCEMIIQDALARSYGMAKE